MPLPGSKILVWVVPPTAFVRLEGRATVERARDFKVLVTRLDAEGIERFCVDLTDCKLMDSTFSGILAALATELGPSTGGPARFVLVNPNARVHDLLDNLGILPLVSLVEGENWVLPEGVATEVAAGPSSKKETALCCLDAHRFLSAIKPENRDKFADVTQILEREVALMP